MKVTIRMIFFHYRKIDLSSYMPISFLKKKKNRSEFSFVPNYNKFYPLISQDLILLNVHVTVGENAHQVVTEFESA